MHGEFVRFFRVFYKRFINILKVHIFCSHINIFSELFSALKLWISLRIGFQRGFFRLQCKSSIQVAQASNSLERDGFFFQGSHKICTVYTLYTVYYTIYSTCHGRACDFFRFTVNFFFCLFFFRCNWTVQFELYLNWNWNGIGLFQLWFRLECIDLIDSFNILYFFLQVFHLFILFYFILIYSVFCWVFFFHFFLYRFFRCFFPCITNCMYQTR